MFPITCSTLNPSAEAAALAATYRKNPTPGRSWPAARVKEEAMARVAAAGGDAGIWQLVLSESALQFGQYRGKTFKWLLSNDVGYAAMVLASHRQERERGDTSTAPVMANKDALLQYSGLFPDVVAAIQERQVREGSGTAGQEDELLVGFGNYATLTFKDLYDAKDKERKGFIRWVRQKKDVHPGTKMYSLQKYIKRRDAEKLQPNLPKTALPASSSVSAEELSDADLLAAAAPIDVVAGTSQSAIQPEALPSSERGTPKESAPTEDLLLPEGWKQTLPKEQHLWVSKCLFTKDKFGKLALTKKFRLGVSPGPPRCTLAPCKTDPFFLTVRRVLDLNGWYFMATEYLECRSCKKKLAAWSQDILDQLDPSHREQFPAVLTYRLSCDREVVRLMRGAHWGTVPQHLVTGTCGPQAQRTFLGQAGGMYLTCAEEFWTQGTDPSSLVAPLPQCARSLSILAAVGVC
ncbi:hypothetical protein QQF64_031694 [Cirrhinus molitorella]|uniref:DUF6729 domain-containing protein n=1 Tax=Cirrhinus molitorella TaxID=172907 RepID=A0ABR3MXP6_9TELE